MNYRVIFTLINKISTVQRTIILVIMDGLISCLTLGMAFYFRFPMGTAFYHIIQFWWILLLGVAIRLGTFRNYGLYTFLWRYASVKEMVAVVKAITFSSIFLMGFLFLLNGFQFPSSIIIIDWALCVVFIGSFRIGLRMIREHHQNLLKRTKTIKTKNILIIGAGDGGEIIAREVLRSSHLEFNLIGFVDDKADKVGQNIHQMPVLGTTENIPELADKYQIQEVIIAIPSASGADIRRIVSICEQSSIKARITPGLYDIIDGRVSVNELREVQIEDLLGRDVVRANLDAVSGYLAGQVVLVTGAGGSIGSELCRQIIQFSPRRLILLDHSESNTYHIDMELRKLSHAVNLIPAIADIKNKGRLDRIFEKYRPDIVFHAAAYKHVPLMEENVEEVVLNNVNGTLNLVKTVGEYKAKRCILISTDKAVRPANCMGASKRVGEMIMQIEAENSSTIFTAVRFGNVLGSNGSVVPLFKKQISEGGPITVTHPEVTRFFMTIPEAVRLVLQAGVFCQGGEIFILDMGEPVKIVNLARDMIKLSGLQENHDIEIQYVGLRPGEKMYEELSFDKEQLTATENKKIFVTRPSTYNKKEIKERIEDLIQGASLRHDEENRHLLHTIASEDHVIETVNQ